MFRLAVDPTFFYDLQKNCGYLGLAIISCRDLINETIKVFFPSFCVPFEVNKQPKGVLFNCTWVMDIFNKRKKPLYETQTVSPFVILTVFMSLQAQICLSTTVDGQYDPTEIQCS